MSHLGTRLDLAVVMFSITPSIVMQKRKILNCRKKIIFNLENNLKNARKYSCNKRMRTLLLHGAAAAVQYSI